uniref:TIMELESS-interacting protein n=1 Tax=Salarias fasciatus TaxID=181472 RepID=A0A672JMK7_SALFA
MRGVLELSDPPEYESLEDDGLPPLPPPDSPGPGGPDDEEPFSNAGLPEVTRLQEDEPSSRCFSRCSSVCSQQREALSVSSRLISDRGLPALRPMFPQAEDLRLLMQRMENWAHRLFPKLRFEDFIDRVEKLGAKKEVQTCLKRIRLDMPLTHEDFTASHGQKCGKRGKLAGPGERPCSHRVQMEPGPTSDLLLQAAPAPPTSRSLQREERVTLWLPAPHVVYVEPNASV